LRLMLLDPPLTPEMAEGGQFTYTLSQAECIALQAWHRGFCARERKLKRVASSFGNNAATVLATEKRRAQDVVTDFVSHYPPPRFHWADEFFLANPFQGSLFSLQLPHSHWPEFLIDLIDDCYPGRLFGVQPPSHWPDTLWPCSGQDHREERREQAQQGRAGPTLRHAEAPGGSPPLPPWLAALQPSPAPPWHPGHASALSAPDPARQPGLPPTAPASWQGHGCAACA
jgi:hypothetical protein